jgi:hypothetical protein
MRIEADITVTQGDVDKARKWLEAHGWAAAEKLRAGLGEDPKGASR